MYVSYIFIQTVKLKLVLLSAPRLFVALCVIPVFSHNIVLCMQFGRP